MKQLNVTEELAASVVRAMSAETKKLVVTEDAILQRATVIENIVTPEVIAQRIRVEDIAAEMMTSSLLQTDRDARRGMKLNNAGISAFNAAGEQTVKIDASGTDNYIRGVFSTAADDKAGLTIRTTQGPISGESQSLRCARLMLLSEHLSALSACPRRGAASRDEAFWHS